MYLDIHELHSDWGWQDEKLSLLIIQVHKNYDTNQPEKYLSSIYLFIFKMN